MTESQSRTQQLAAELAALKAAKPLYPEAANSDLGQQNPSESQSRIQQLEAELAALKAAKLVYPDAIRINLQQQNLVLAELADERSRLPAAAKFNLEQQNLVMTELANERSRLSDALRTLTTSYQILLDTNTNQLEIIQPATTATLVDQQLWLKVISSGVGGLIFGIIIIFVAEHFDDRLRFPSDLSRTTGVPVLSTIDSHASQNGAGAERLVTFAQPESDAANRYREVVAKLLFSIGESIPYTLLLSSVGSKAGT